MKYIYKETNISLNYQNIYLKARKEKKELKCFIGIDKNYRVLSRDSYFDNISDMDIILESCIYPLYTKGYIEIKDEVQKIVESMINSNDVLQIFQVFNLIMSQEIEMRMYSNIPFQIDFSTNIDKLLEKKNELKLQMKNYKENGFERYNESMWDFVEKICRKSIFIRKYI